jgi:hypothetical protein
MRLSTPLSKAALGRLLRQSEEDDYSEEELGFDDSSGVDEEDEELEVVL